MRGRVGGQLNTQALARLHFNALSRDQQIQAIRRLAATGQGEATIAAATGLAIEVIRVLLAEKSA